MNPFNGEKGEWQDLVAWIQFYKMQRRGLEYMTSMANFSQTQAEAVKQHG